MNDNHEILAPDAFPCLQISMSLIQKIELPAGVVELPACIEIVPYGLAYAFDSSVSLICWTMFAVYGQSRNKKIK